MPAMFSSPPKPKNPGPSAEQKAQQALAEQRAQRARGAGKGYSGTLVSEAYKNLNTTLG